MAPIPMVSRRYIVSNSISWSPMGMERSNDLTRSKKKGKKTVYGKAWLEARLRDEENGVVGRLALPL